MSAAQKKRSRGEGKKYRFVVSSAEEAVSVIRDQLGETARVLSVEQVNGKGLAKFLSSPQLEVIAYIPTRAELAREKAAKAEAPAGEEVEEAAAPQAAPAAAPTPAAQPEPTPAPAPKAAAAEAEGPAGRGRRRSRSRLADKAAEAGQQPAAGARAGRGPRPASRVRRSPAAKPAPAANAAPPAKQAQPKANGQLPAPAAKALPQADNPEAQREEGSPLTPSGQETLETLLEKARFDSDLITRMEASTDWKRLSGMNLKHGLSEVFYWLREQYSQVPAAGLARRSVFLGTPGVGKTTCLCKRLSNDVFVQGKQIQVIKIEAGTPNSDENLHAFCEACGVTLLRDPVDPGEIHDGTLYVDVPGIPLHESEQWEKVSKRLDELQVESRIIVLNAAYEKELLKDTISSLEHLKPTHLVFTHMDELNNVTKLWPIVLSSGLTTLFLSYGQNVAGEMNDDIEDFLSSRTFPSYLTE